MMRAYMLLAVSVVGLMFAHGAWGSPTGQAGNDPPVTGYGHGIPLPKSVPGPFWLIGSITPVRLQRYRICALVEPSRGARLTHRETQNGRGRTRSAPFYEFDVKVVEGEGLKTGTVRRCIAAGLPPTGQPTLDGRLLLLGWPSEGGTLQVEVGPGVSIDPDESITVKVDCDSIFVGGLLPTNQEHVVPGRSIVARAFLNLGETLLKGTHIEVVRKITSAWARINRGAIYPDIDGVRAPDWVMQNLGSVLARAPQRNAVEKLRFGGLVADWFKPRTTMLYVRSLSALMKELRDKSLTPKSDSRTNDMQFLRSLNLHYGMNPDDLVAIALSDPALRFLALGIAIPSLETQKQMLGFLEDPDINTRAMFYSQFANWYGLREWTLSSGPTYSAPLGYMVIPNESEMHTYWTKKLGGYTGP